MDNTARAENGETLKKTSKNTLFKVSPYMVIPSRVGGFSLYLKQDDRYVLYAERGQLFTEEHKKRLGLLGVKHLYIKGSDYIHYQEYLEDNLLDLLDDESVPVQERARAWNDATVALAKEAFDRRLPAPIDKRQFKRIRTLISNSLKFLAREDALKELGRFIREGDELFRHGISVMVLTVTTLSSFIKDDSEMLVGVGMGAMLHDIGKIELPPELFTKRSEYLSRDEVDLIRSHPALGVGLCSALPLPQETLQCILFHHERADGTGYPSHSSGDLQPAYVKLMSLCNVYDNLTSGRSGRTMTPFEALTHIKAQRGAFDQEMLKKLIAILAKANLT